MHLVYENTKEEIIAIKKTPVHRPPHLHNALEIVYVTEGCVELGVGEELFHMDQGSCIRFCRSYMSFVFGRIYVSYTHIRFSSFSIAHPETDYKMRFCFPGTVRSNSVAGHATHEP